ncbi:calcium-transporting atpase [Vairimorpha apis BRL 01]|uniref:Calcium-transporting atpase n=1 Tax=Vairimorpha apis BRL 01 TaxID=1037528 RepID=T0LDP6_9MICR|nr:calcium-transporting atpase [Vairimorpha apis BRL 01]
MQKLIKNIPKDYEKKINEYSLMGYRLITIAYKEISHFSNRENYEKDLIFLNLIIFSNKLKSETTKVIEELNYANIKSVICTGDNMLTAISVGKECKLIEEGAVVVFPIVSDDCKTIDDVKWECLSEEAYTFDKIRLGLYKNTFDTFNKDFVVACEGREFEFFKKNNGLSFILEKCVVFARFSSGLKKALVEDLRSLNKNILFCGDGANDSGAISSADVGIALSKK